MTILTDDFARPDENPLSKSGAWTTTGAAAPRVVSNQLRPDPTPSFSRSRRTDASIGPAQYAQQRIVTFVNDCGGPSVLQSGSGHYFLTVQGGGTDLVGYLEAPLGSFVEKDRQTGLSIGAGGVVLRIESDGAGNFVGYADGVPLVSWSDSTLTSGDVGTAPYGNSGSGAAFDQWQGGDLIQPPTTVLADYSNFPKYPIRARAQGIR